MTVWAVLQGDTPRHTLQLVPGARLESARSALRSVSGVHVYSLAAAAAKDVAMLYSQDYIQAAELHTQPPEKANCLRDNRHSAVRCPMVKRVQADPRSTHASALPSEVPKSATATRAPTKPAPTPAAPSRTEPPKPPAQEAKTEAPPVRCSSLNPSALRARIPGLRLLCERRIPKRATICSLA
eukprot:1175451-Prorocentrum_minimum.AAC.7